MTTARQQRRAQMLDTLLEVAQAKLAGGGSFVDLNLDEVLAEAGVPKSTFYRYFSGKNELLRSWFEQMTEQAGAQPSWLGGLGPAPLEEVERAMRVRFAAYQPYLPVIAAAFDAAYYDPDLRAAVDAIMERLHEALAADIRTAQEHGAVDPGLPARETAVWLNWMAIRGVNQLLRGADAERVDALLPAFARLVWSTLHVHEAA